MALSADGRRLLTGSGRFYSGRPDPTGPDCSVRLWDVSSGKELGRWPSPRVPVHTVALAPTGRRAAVAGADGIIHLLELR